MSNVLTIPRSKDRLDVIAAEINDCLEAVQDTTLNICILASEARKLCKARGLAFADWARDELERSPNAAHHWAQIGDKANPKQALLEHREKEAKRLKARYDAKLKGSVVEQQPAYDDDDVYDDEVDSDDSYRRKRAFLYRAREAVEHATVDNMDGIEVSDGLIEATLAVVEAWTKLAKQMEKRNYAKVHA